MYVLKETISKNEDIISQADIFKGSYEETQAQMEAKAKADWKATEGIMCEIKHDEDYYSRVENETLNWYRLDIRWEDD